MIPFCLRKDISDMAIEHNIAVTEPKTKKKYIYIYIYTQRRYGINYDKFETLQSDNLPPKFKVSLTCFYSKGNSFFVFLCLVILLRTV